MSLEMSKLSDEHTNHPVCDICGMEFDNVNDLTVHVEKEHQHKY